MLNWTNKQDGVDDVLAEDINSIANNLIETQRDLEELESYAVPIKDNFTPTESVYAQKSFGEGIDGVITIDIDLNKNNDSVEYAPLENANKIPIRNAKGSLYVPTPEEDMEAVNRKYVDDKLGDIETLLGGI